MVKVTTRAPLVLLAVTVLFCFTFVLGVYVAFCAFVFGSQYQCNRLPGKNHLQNDLLCVEWDVKLYAVTRTLSMSC